VALSFVFSTFVLGVLMAALSFFSFDANYGAVSGAASDLAKDLRRSGDGRLALAPGSEFSNLPPAGAWAVVKDEEGSTLTLGAPPPEVAPMAAAAPVALTAASALHFELPSPGRDSKVRLDAYDTQAGPVLIVIGGVDPAEVGLAALLVLTQANVYIAAIPVVLVLAVVLWLIIAPLVFKGVRPLAAAAAAIDGSDPARRLPEAGVTAELLPIVQAFNGALDRMEQMLERRRRFMADAAHELRTPLAVLNMQVEQLPPTASRTDLQRGVYRMSQMVGQMLDAEQMKGPGRAHDPVDLAWLVREAPPRWLRWRSPPATSSTSTRSPASSPSKARPTRSSARSTICSEMRWPTAAAPA
jgi:signal transduction histidine kinase